jgi:hypothetical protein
MKKIILSAAALFVFGFASAQDAKESTGGKGFANGDIFVSGSVGFNSDKTPGVDDDVKTTSFNISPKVGFFVTDNIAVGGKVGFTSEKTDFGSGDDATSDKFSIGAFGRYYATPTSDFSVFAELGFNYNTSNENAGTGGDDFKVNGFDIALAPGVSYFISSNFALEASIAALSYETSKPDADGAENTTDFGLNVDLSNISLGLVYKF